MHLSTKLSTFFHSKVDNLFHEGHETAPPQKPLGRNVLKRIRIVHLTSEFAIDNMFCHHQKQTISQIVRVTIS